MPASPFLLAIALFAGPASAKPPVAKPVSLEARVALGDVVYSERARRGAPLWLVEKPDRHAAGLAMPAGVATLYSNGNGNGNSGNDGNGNNGGGNGNSDHDGNDHNDDGHTDSGQGNGNNGNNNAPPVTASELIANNEFIQGLSGWEADGAYVSTEYGPIRADPGLTADGVFAVVHNGYWDQRTQGHISQSIQVPMARTANFAMLYNFVTAEFPTWQGTEFNDHFKMTLTGPSGELELSKAEFLNSGSFTEVRGVPMYGWDYDSDGNVIAGQTGWQSFNYSRLPLKSGLYSLRIEVNDVGDDIVDSAILVDRVSLR
ncbi:MAG: hypothetical protein HYZ75_07240 [Elusimicrobia bacterium]|nr:hypothetical protein [Elusimicrobiota bacterium]